MTRKYVTRSTEVYERTKKLLIDKRDGLIKLADKLLEKEILFQSDLEEILGKRPFEHRTTYDEFVNGTEKQTRSRQPETWYMKVLPIIQELLTETRKKKKQRAIKNNI